MEKLITVELNPKYFPLPLDVRWLDGKLWRLLAPFEYHDREGNIYRAEKDFITDFGSKPFFTWSLIGSPTDEAGGAYIIHDWLCCYAIWGYAKTDKVFLDAMRDSGVAYLKRMLQYAAVRLAHFGKP
jgi:hypothetical protein